MASDPSTPAPANAPIDDARMPLLAHLQELRIRLIRAFIAVGLGFAIAYAFADTIFNMLTLPFLQVAGSNALLVGTGVVEAFMTKIKVAIIAGLFIASPAVFYEVWRFIAPGLYASEKRTARPFVIATTACFLAGGYFCYAIIMPVGYGFFLGEYASINVTPTIRISEYLSFASRMILAFGLTFEMPVLAYFLTRLGIIDYTMLMRHWRWIVVGVAVAAAAFTPPDAVSMMLLGIPLMALYAVSFAVTYFFRLRPQEKAAPATDGPAAQ
ncbi:MAG: twin-arginine translocase subunit TatC [Candidatus Binataceae bacterium]